MARRGDIWIEIRADYAAGMSVTALYAKYRTNEGVTIASIISRAQTEGWKVGEPPPNEPEAAAPDPGDEPVRLPVKAGLDANQRAEVKRLHAETATDVIKRHKRSSEQMWALLDYEMAEFQEMQRLTASFCDKEYIAKLEAEAAKTGDPTKHLKYLSNAQKAAGMRGAYLKNLTDIQKVVIVSERLSWGLGEDGGGDEKASYEELLARIRNEPYVERTLPDNVLNFDTKLRKQPPP